MIYDRINRAEKERQKDKKRKYIVYLSETKLGRKSETQRQKEREEEFAVKHLI